MKEGLKGRQNMWLSSIPNVQRKQNFCSEGWLAIGSACQGGEQLLSLLGSLIAQVMERVFCIYSTALLWARESGPGVRLGQGGWQVISPNPEREFLLTADPAWWEPGWVLPLHMVTLSSAPQEGTATPSQLEESSHVYSRFSPFISSSYQFPLLFTCFLLVSLPFTTLSWTGSSSTSHLTGAGTGFFSREARCTW